jgi:acyl-CoA reductase-like NAD-dependent aldehyde dehydrogenase
MSTASLAKTAAGPRRHKVSPGRLYIAGEWRDGGEGKTFPTVDPATQQTITDIAEGTAADVEDAVKAAQAALDGEWGRMSGHERGRVLWRVGELVRENAGELAALEAMDMGKLYRDAVTIDAPHVANTYQYFAGWASKLDGVAKDAPVKYLNHFAFTRREPIGVVCAISPFNYPLVLSTHKIAPALACGNAVIHKPASTTPLSAIRIAQIMEEAGVPKGAFQLIIGPGRTVGQALVEHPGIHKLSLTGSTATGKRMIRDSAEMVKHVTMELGGKSANIVFADADLDAATELAYWGLFYNKGENCYAGSRMLVERRVYDEMVERVAVRAKTVVLGDPFDPATEIGPIADASEFEHVMSFMDIGRENGGRLVAGGGSADPLKTGKSWFVQPTVFADVSPDARLFNEETFGPILAMTPFEDADDAVRLANASLYGLAAGVQSRDVTKALKVANRLEAGSVWINTYGQFDPSTPFGGYKQSGYGRENGPEAIEDWTQTKAVWVNLGA